MKKDLQNLRTRNWAFIMYPDSIPCNDFNKAIAILQDSYLPFAVSPLHDKDFNADGEQKKPHWHVLLTADGPKSYNQIKEIALSVNGSDCRAIDSASGYYRYLTHKDNPEKAQYNECDIRHYNNFDYETYTKPTAMQRYLQVRDMVNFIKENKIYSYNLFVDMAISHNFEWFKLLCDNCSFLIKEYIYSFKTYNSLV